MLEKAFGAAQFDRLVGRDHPVAGEIPPVPAQAGGATDPSEHLEVPQAAGALLAIGLECIRALLVARIALFLLELFGLVETVHVECGLEPFDQRVEKRLRTQQQTHLEQIGLDRDVIGGDRDAFAHGSHAVTDMQSDIPQGADETGQRRFELRAGGRWQQDQQVDVGKRK
jgi:hypothetical protein